MPGQPRNGTAPADSAEVMARKSDSLRNYRSRRNLRRSGRRERWLLVKQRDEAADGRRNPVSTPPESVLSGRTVEQVAREESPS